MALALAQQAIPVYQMLPVWALVGQANTEQALEHQVNTVWS